MRSPRGVPPSTPDEDRELHARLLNRDPAATADLALAYLESLVTWLRRSFSRDDHQLLESVAIDLILSLASRPEQYDPDRANLTTYLRMAARADVSNARRSEQRRGGRHVPLEDVELSQRAGNTLIEVPQDPADVVADAEAPNPEAMAALRERFDEVEWEVVQLMLEGERRTPIFAQVLGLQDRPEIEQTREVKRVKDRLQKRLRRLAPRLLREADDDG